jgi:hypothetical protein
VPASGVKIRAGTVGPVPGGRVVFDGVVDRVQRTGPLLRVRIRGDGYLITGYPDGDADVTVIGQAARALVDPATARTLPQVEPAQAAALYSPPSRMGRLLRRT